MSESIELRLTLDTNTPGEPVGGWFAQPNGEQARFDGMLELIALIDRAREDEKSDAAAAD